MGGSRGSGRSSNTNNNNALIEQAAALKGDDSAIQALANANKAGSECEKVSKKDWQTMHTTHIHKPMYTTPGMEHLRHKTVD